MLRVWRAAMLAVLLASCGSANLQPTVAPSAPLSSVDVVAATPSPSPTLSPYPVFTVDPGTTAAAGEIRVIQVVVRTWASFGEVRAVLIAEVTNMGTVTADIEHGEHHWSIPAASRAVLAAGTYMSATDRILAPGQTGYLWTEVVLPGKRLPELGTALVEPDWKDVDVDTRRAQVDRIHWRRAPYSDGLIATGRVTNKTEDELAVAQVAIVFLDKGGRPLGIITDSSARTLPPGASAGWQTDSSSPPISAKDVGSIQVFTIVQ